MKITHEELEQDQEEFNRLLRIVNSYKHAMNLASFNRYIIAGSGRKLLTSFPEFNKHCEKAKKAYQNFYAHPFTTGFDIPSDFEDQAYELWLEELPPEAIPF
jgi:hypothetical protein